MMSKAPSPMRSTSMSITCSGIHEPGGFSLQSRAFIPVKVEPGTSR
jgi:hypothetical protein